MVEEKRRKNNEKGVEKKSKNKIIDNGIIRRKTEGFINKT